MQKKNNLWPLSKGIETSISYSSDILIAFPIHYQSECVNILFQFSSFLDLLTWIYCSSDEDHLEHLPKFAKIHSLVPFPVTTFFLIPLPLTIGLKWKEDNWKSPCESKAHAIFDIFGADLIHFICLPLSLHIYKANHNPFPCLPSKHQCISPQKKKRAASGLETN